MKSMRCLAVLAALCWASPALAQSSPNFSYGQVPTAGQLNFYFAGKADYTGLVAVIATASGAVPKSTTVSAGTGLSGGGALSSNITLSVANGGISNSLLATAPAGTLKGNLTGSVVSPSDSSLSAYLDAATSTTQGSILYRGASSWSALPPGSSGQVLSSGGATANPAWMSPSTGTVTSVAVTVPSDETVAGSPVTTSGTVAITRSAQLPNLVLAGPASGSSAAPTYRALVAADIPASADGCVRVSVSSTTVLQAAPYNCATIVINGVPQVQTTITYTASGLSASTKYYAYEYLNSGALTLTVSATGYTVDSSGRANMTGNTAYRLVGMVYTNSSGAPFLSSLSFQGVLNWFNRRILNTTASCGGATSSSSTSVECTASRVTALAWADEAVTQQIVGYITNTTANANNIDTPWIDGAAAGTSIFAPYPSAGAAANGANGLSISLSEGVHVISIGIGVSGASGTGTFSLTSYLTTRG